jgi:hypothetical protein
VPYYLSRHVSLRGIEVLLQAFVASALDVGELSASRPGRFTPEDTAPGVHQIGGWVYPTASLEAAEKGKISCPEGNRTQES